jgi:hypothetical protein
MLEKEIEYYNGHRAELWKSDPGKYVLIKNDSLIGIYLTLEEAIIEGIRRFGIGPFMARQIAENDRTIFLPALTLGLLRADSIRPA